MITRLAVFVGALICSIMPWAAAEAQFVNHGAARHFLEIDVHALAGGSITTQNYMSLFPEIKELNSSLGSSFGGGASALFSLRDYLAFGTEFNVLFNNNNMDLAVSNDGVTSVSNIFLRNRYYYVNVPVFMSFRFNIGNVLRWNIDAGLYYAYGFGGRQDQSIYSSRINELGQLIPQVIITRPPYFKSGETFINGYYRSDIGLHIGTGLAISSHYLVGARLNLGLKNISHTDGIKQPNIHNLNFHVMVGYRFW